MISHGSARRDLVMARAAATSIDVGLAAVAYSVVALASVLVGVVARGLADALGWVAVLAAIATYLYNVGYLQATKGQSIGRQRTGIWLRSEDGISVPTTGQVWGRAGIDLIGLFTAGVLFLADRIVALVRPDQRRLSDLVLRTLVCEITP